MEAATKKPVSRTDWIHDTFPALICKAFAVSRIDVESNRCRKGSCRKFCPPDIAGILCAVNGFLIEPMIAGAAMALRPVSVTVNSLRLKQQRSEHEKSKHDQNES